ncbi:MAG: hypothetical protein AAF658_07100 [Myxococcota bacterium]
MTFNVRGSVARGLGVGLALAIVLMWPVARIDTALVEAIGPTPFVLALLRFAHQLVLWSVGATVALFLGRRGYLERVGAMLCAVSPVVLDSVKDLAFGAMPLVLASWVDRAVFAVSATVVWIFVRHQTTPPRE